MLSSLDVLHNIAVEKADIEAACEELKANSSPGPDGVPSILLKECRKELSGPLATFWRASLDLGIIPEELLLVQICPLHKGGSKADPTQFRPVALTSHLIKTFEKECSGKRLFNILIDKELFQRDNMVLGLRDPYLRSCLATGTLC